MALPASALTTLATALDELGIASVADPTTSGTASTDSRVERYVRAASGYIRKICSRDFENVAAVVESRPAFGFTKLYLERTPIVSVAGIVIDGATLDPTTYELRDAGTEKSLLWRELGWMWSASRMPGIVQAPMPGQEKRTVVVTYAGGYVTPQQVVLNNALTRTLPDDLEDACLELVTMRWRRRGTSVAVRQQAGQAASWAFGGEAIPAEVRQVIEGYARVVHR